MHSWTRNLSQIHIQNLSQIRLSELMINWILFLFWMRKSPKRVRGVPIYWKYIWFWGLKQKDEKVVHRNATTEVSKLVKKEDLRIQIPSYCHQKIQIQILPTKEFCWFKYCLLFKFKKFKEKRSFYSSALLFDYHSGPMTIFVFALLSEKKILRNFSSSIF